MKLANHWQPALPPYHRAHEHAQTHTDPHLPAPHATTWSLYQDPAYQPVVELVALHKQILNNLRISVVISSKGIRQRPIPTQPISGHWPYIILHTKTIPHIDWLQKK